MLLRLLFNKFHCPCTFHTPRLAAQRQLVNAIDSACRIRRAFPQNPLGKTTGLLADELIVQERQGLWGYGGEITARTTTNRTRTVEGLQKRKQVRALGGDVNAPEPGSWAVLHVFGPLLIIVGCVNDRVRVNARFYHRPIKLPIEAAAD